MMSSNLQHRRTHNLLLISKLLDQRDTASPFTLILDSLEQSAKPLIKEYIRRAKAVDIQIVFVSSETLRKPSTVDHFVQAGAETDLQTLQKDVTDSVKPNQGHRTLLVFDALNTLYSSDSQTPSLPGLLSALISPTTSVLAVYHKDVRSSLKSRDIYSPSPIKLLEYLATSIFAVHSLHHVRAGKTARQRSHAEPSFGLAEGVEGVLQGLDANGTEGIVLEMEHRRKSGRGVREWYFLRHPSQLFRHPHETALKSREAVMLLEDHVQDCSLEPAATAAYITRHEVEATFELGLTEKQKRDREGVVLPYFDAQMGGGEGGRILYDMGSEDDFDEEEDEV